MIKNLIFLFLILGFVAIVIFLDIPAVREVLNLKKILSEQTKILGDKQEFSIKLEKLIKNYEDNKKDAEKVNYALPLGKEIPNLIVQFEALGAEGGMTIEQIGFSSVEGQATSKAKVVRTETGEGINQQTGDSAKNYKTIAVNLKMSGDYYAFKNFLVAVEKNIRLMNIETINFTSLSGQDSQLFNFEVTLKTYYQQ
jgi:Tfp pilus assembly protein PilO